MNKKSIINFFLIFSFLLSLSITLWIYYQMKNNIGDIEFDEQKDDPSFSICNEKKIFQYYAVGTGYVGERKELREEIYRYLKTNFIKELEKSGYVTFRFVVNCNGESGMFRHKSVNMEFKEMNLSSGTIKKLEQSIMSLKNWKQGSINNTFVDSYYQINFKITKGQIIDIF